MMNRLLALVLVLTMCLFALPVAYADGSENQVVTIEYAPDAYLPTIEDVFKMQVEKELYGGISLFTVGDERSAGAQLKGDDKTAYDALVPVVKAIAAGNRESTQLTISQISYCDHNAVIDALLADCAYEMYWYGNKCQLSMGYGFTFSFEPAQAYKGDGDYKVNTTKTSAAAAAAANAADVVKANAGKPDYEKLVAYRNYICGAVSYNDAAADNNNTPYGDPWQLIYVFDGNPDTNVVCEGYSKAFQYLCELTNFNSSDIFCYLVSGDMGDSGSLGAHMWNIVTMDDGKNYLVDVTNCDSGTIGYPDGLFLKGYDRTVTYSYNDGTTQDAYRFDFNYSSVDFLYDLDLPWGSSVLTISQTDYIPGTSHTCSFSWKDGNATTATHHTLTCTCGETQQEAHSWMYVASGNAITAACEVCSANGGKVSISAPSDLVYSGSAKEAKVNSTISGVYPDVAYTGNLTDGKPVKAGKYTASITLGGQTVSVEYTVTQKVLKPTVVLEETDYTYDGKAKEPGVSVMDGDIVVEPHEYRVFYENNINAGTATVLVDDATAGGNYALESVTVQFTIKQAELTDDMVSLSVDSMVHTGSALTPEVTVSSPAKSTDYTVSYSNNTAVGTATVTVTGQNNYTGTVTKTFKITAHEHSWTYSASGNTITAVCSGEGNCEIAGKTATVTVSGGTHTYDGAAKQATVTQNPADTFSGVKVTYHAEPLNAGAYTASITLGGVTATDTLTINPKPVNPTVVMDNAVFTYDGTEKKPAVTVKDGDTVLNSSEYSVSYANNTNAGTATVTVSDAADGNYALAQTPATFTINAAQLTADMVSLSADAMVYTGGEQKPEVTVTGLTLDTDYTVAYSDNINIGTAKVTVTGKGNYAGTVEKTFRITAHEHSWTYSVSGNTITAVCVNEGVCEANNSATVSVTDKTHTYDGTPKAVTVTQSPENMFSGVTVQYDIDTTTYDTPPIDAGVYTVRFTLGGVTASDTMTINRKKIKPTIELSETSYTYDGTEKYPAATVKDGDSVIHWTEYNERYTDNLNAGTAKLTVGDVDNGNYEIEETTVEFTINPASLTDGMVILYADSMVYTGSALTPEVAVTGLVKDTDYTVAYSNNVNIGTAKVTVTGKGNYAGTVEKTFKITAHEHSWTYSASGNVITATCGGAGTCDAGKTATVTITGGTYTYDGAAKQATVTQNPENTFTGVQMVYTDNKLPVNAGEYTVGVTLGGVTATDKLTIERKSITPTVTVTESSKPRVYNGNEWTPGVRVYDGDVWLDAGEYMVFYEDNVDAGTAKAIVKNAPGGNYKLEQVEAEFTIHPATLTDDMVSLPASAMEYTGSELKPAVTVTSPATTNDYDVSYSNNTAVGTATVTVTGKNNYTGTVTKTFEITTHVHQWTYSASGNVITAACACATEGNAVTVTLTGGTYTYDGTAKQATVTQEPAGVFGDIDMRYSADPVNAGSYTASITLGGATASAAITIEPKAITADFSAVAASYPFTGSEIKPAVTVADGANTVAQSEYTVVYSDNVNVGTAKITVADVDGGNYIVSGTKEFSIVKAAAPAVQPCEVAVLREIDTTGNAVDLAKLLPENRGATTYAIASSSDNAAVKNFTVDAAGKVTFDTAKSDAASEAVYVIKAVMQNYNDAQITVKIILSDKEQVTITGASAASGLTYDGTAKTGYTGTPSAAPYTGAFSAVYTGTQADGTVYGPAQQAPVNAGSYTVTISVPDSAVYAGSTTISFAIAKAKVTIKANDRTELVGQAMPDLGYEVTGLVGSDQLTTAPTIACTPDMNVAGTYPITVSGAEAGANYEIAYQAGTLSVVMGGTESAAAQIVAKELTNVAPALLSTPFNTVDKIKAEQTRTLIEGNTDYTEENVAHYDVKLQFSLDGGKTWIDASEVNFPFGGVTVRIAYPQGTSKDTHDFIVSHMFTETSERLGTVAGQTEQPAVVELEDALEFTVTGLSPVSIAWKETSEVQDAANSLPKTGDVSTIFIWTLLCFAALIGSSLASSRREY